MKALPSVRQYFAITSFSVATIVTIGMLVSQNYRTYRTSTKVSYDTTRGGYLSEQSLFPKKIREILLNPTVAEKFASTVRTIITKEGGPALLKEINRSLGIKKDNDPSLFNMLFLRFFDRNFDFDLTIQSPFLEASFEESMVVFTTRLKEKEFAAPMVKAMVAAYNNLVADQHTARIKTHKNLSRAASEGAARRLSEIIDDFLKENKEQMKELQDAQQEFAVIVTKISLPKGIIEKSNIAMNNRTNKLSREVDNGPEILRRNYIDFMDTLQEVKNSLMLYSNKAPSESINEINDIEAKYYRSFVKLEPSLMQLELTTNGFREELSILSTQQIAEKQFLPYLDVQSMQLPDPNTDFLFDVSPSKKVILILSTLGGLFLGFLLCLSLRQLAVRKLEPKTESVAYSV